MGGGEVLLGPLLYLDWGRCGLLGGGSSVVRLGGNYVSWSTPGDLVVSVRCQYLSCAGVGGSDSLDLSWRCGCEGILAASQY